MKMKPSKKSGQVLAEIGPQDSERLSRSVELSRPNPGPFQLKRILVPIDFSACSRKALQYALPFAKQFNAAITLLNVVRINYAFGTEYGSVDFPFIEAEVRKGAEKQLVELAAENSQFGVSITSEVRGGLEAQGIAAAAKSLEVDLIIIATHGHTGLKHLFLGSVAENVIRFAPCPVLVVREKEHEFVVG
jgi:universal stress protein A